MLRNLMRNWNWFFAGCISYSALERYADGMYQPSLILACGAAVIALCQIISELSPEKPPRELPPTKTTAYVVTDNPYQAPQQT